MLQRLGLTDKAPDPEPPPKNAAAVELGRRGGKARAAKLSEEEQKRIGEAAARARWNKKKHEA